MSTKGKRGIAKPKIQRIAIEEDVYTFTCSVCKRSYAIETRVYGHARKFDPLQDYCKRCATKYGIQQYDYPGGRYTENG